MAVHFFFHLFIYLSIHVYMCRFICNLYVCICIYIYIHVFFSTALWDLCRCEHKWIRPKEGIEINLWSPDLLLCQKRSVSWRGTGSRRHHQSHAPQLGDDEVWSHSRKEKARLLERGSSPEDILSTARSSTTHPQLCHLHFFEANWESHDVP